MFVELHILQNFAPSNLNRDDTGAPKDCEFGGCRRARISSQCIKRAIRRVFAEGKLLPRENLACRTKRLVEELADRLSSSGKDKEQARGVVEAMLNGVKLAVKDDGKTQYLLFLGDAEITALATLCAEHWKALTKVAGADAGKAEDGKKRKKAAKAAVPEEIRKALDKLLDGGKAADLALFGRMLADIPEKNIDAACQVAHALSTNRVSMEFDYYTAVDDLKPEDTAGADMIGTVEFNSACYYRYANIDADKLLENLDGDEELARKTIEAFLRASCEAIPTGKQNSFAAHNPPSFILAVVRDGSAPLSLANAFEKPIGPGRDGGLVTRSVAALDGYWARLVAAYGKDGVRQTQAMRLDDEPELAGLGLKPVSFEDLVGKTVSAIEFNRKGEGK